jgi:hypothetical protein
MQVRSAVTCADIIPDSANEASSLSPRSLFLFFLPCQSPSPHVDDLLLHLFCRLLLFSSVSRVLSLPSRSVS